MTDTAMATMNFVIQGTWWKTKSMVTNTDRISSIIWRNGDGEDEGEGGSVEGGGVGTFGVGGVGTNGDGVGSGVGGGVGSTGGVGTGVGGAGVGSAGGVGTGARADSIAGRGAPAAIADAAITDGGAHTGTDTEPHGHADARADPVAD